MQVQRRAAKVLLVDPAGRSLLFQGGGPAATGAARFWFPPGGGAEEGETLADAARREILEEVGVDLLRLGDVVARREATFTFEGVRYVQDEHFFHVFVPPVTVDQRGWTEVERRAITATHWWPRLDLHRTREKVFPDGLAELLDRVAPITVRAAGSRHLPLPDSSRLAFALPTATDLDALAATGLGMPRPPSREDAAGWLEAVQEHHSRHGFGYWSLQNKLEPSCVGFAGVDDRGDGEMWLGYAIHPSFRRRGLATEAAQAVVSWAGRWLDGPLFASIRPPNPASDSVLRNAGLHLHLRMVDDQGPRQVFVRR